jgi:hypothetical protein
MMVKNTVQSIRIRINAVSDVVLPSRSAPAD